MPQKIAKEMWENWITSKTTQAILNNLKELKHEHEEMMNIGKTVSYDSVDRTALLTTKEVGYCAGLQEAIDYFKEPKDDDEE